MKYSIEFFSFNKSFLNIDFSDMKEGDYELFLISDKYQYRIDLISILFYDNMYYSYIILLVNNIKDILDLRSGVYIKIPKVSYLEKKYFNTYKEFYEV